MIRLPSNIRITQISDDQPTPSFFIRFRDPIERLTTNWSYVRSDAEDAELHAAEADVVIVQRAYSLSAKRLVARIKAAGISVIYETDDLLLDLPPESGLRVTPQQKEGIAFMLDRADAVTCSTISLAERLAQYSKNVRVLENYGIPFPMHLIAAAQESEYHVAIVNTDYFKLMQKKQDLFHAIRRALRTLDCRMSFFGSIDPQMHELQGIFPSQVEVNPCFIPHRKRFLAYLLKKGINAAIVPLQDTVHHRYKSDIKFLDFASIGSPGIYNNSTCYPRVLHRQTGYLCDGSNDGWLAGLTYFADGRVRKACGETAYRTVRRRTLDTYAMELGEVIMGVLGLRETVSRVLRRSVDRSTSGDSFDATSTAVETLPVPRDNER